MLQAPNLPISEATQAYLDSQQAAIDAQATWSARVAEMKMRWAKKMDNEGFNAFTEIHGLLPQMAVGGRYCNYCEQNLIMPTTIEHIRPKGTFPSHAFVWENMVGTCENCNMGFKKAQMWVFDPHGSDRGVVVGNSEPRSQDLAFIDLRSENPQVYMELDFQDFQFKVHRDFETDPRAIEKVRRTHHILFRRNALLPRSREAAFEEFVRRLNEYCAVLDSSNFAELEAAIKYPSFDTHTPFESEKIRLLDALRRSMKRHAHQTVLAEMVRFSMELPHSIQNLITKSNVATW